MRAGALAAVAACLLPCASCAASNGEGHDAVPESRDVRVGGTDTQHDQGYEYIARRPLGVVALAEARGIDSDVAHAAIDRLADALDACATDEGRKGTLADGAARVIAQVDASGAIAAARVTQIDPGDAVARNAVVCLLAPVKLLAFPPAPSDADAGARGFAIEALWGRVMPSRHAQ
jgi:hypothetical protein